MRKTIQCLTALLLVSVSCTYAQSITQQTFTPAGRFLSNQGLQLNFTAGELSIKNLKGQGVDMTTGLFGKEDEAAIILPVTLVDFRLASVASTVRLYWTVVREQNASHYEVMKSTDGTTFSSIGSVAALGAVASQRQYDFTDPAFATKSYYRLKMVDADGRFKFSNTLFIAPQTPTATLSVYPNPVNNFVGVNISAAEAAPATVCIYSTAGTVLINKSYLLTKGLNVFSLNTASLAPGTYFLSVQTKDGLFTRQLSKQR